VDAVPAVKSLVGRGLGNNLDDLPPTIQEGGRLRHPTFQRTFGRAEFAREAGSSLGHPLNAISGSQMKPKVNKAAFRPATRHPVDVVTFPPPQALWPRRLAQEVSAFASLQSANLKHNRK
jgi:hypothetical protein